MPDCVLKLSKIKKSFPGVMALKGVDFELRAGDVHALVGGNGAGKSTLMNIIGGDLQPDAGEIVIDGQRRVLESPKDAEVYGISFIHQELSLFDNMDIASNLFIRKMPMRRGIIDYRALYRNTIAILREIGLAHRKPTDAVASLSMGERQLVEIGRALTQETKILVLDEPTSSLTKRETDTLFDIVLRMKQRGVAIIFITHRLDEIFKVCNRVTVLRDGYRMDSRDLADIDKKEIIRLMVGSDAAEMYSRQRHPVAETLLEVRDLGRKEKFSDISFSVAAGEIVGLYGLLGSGRSEIVRAIFGLEPGDSGEIRVSGSPVKVKSPQDAIASGIALLTEDRRHEGLVIEQSVGFNLTVASIRKFCRLGFVLDAGRERATGAANVEKLNIRTSSLRKTVGYLSGGNQQKVVISKWMNTNPKVLILDEPTRGVDIGAKKEIYKIVDMLLREGVGILFISSELPEMLSLCDRVAVIRDGRMESMFSGADITQEKLLSAAMGV